MDKRNHPAARCAGAGEQTSTQYAIDRPQVFQRFADRAGGAADWSPGQRVLDVGREPASWLGARRNELARAGRSWAWIAPG